MLYRRAYRHILTILAGFLVLQACGFQPLYGDRPGATAVENLAAINIALIRDRTGQLLRNELLDRMNPRALNVAPQYSLTVDLSESKQNLAVRRDDTATLANLILSANYILTASTGDELLTGTVQSFNSYNISSSDFATIAAETDARARAARDLAEGITIRISVFLADLREAR
ncbi:MAG: LPS assembly lipoprotein LptE [Alphaproteobacteria bacterium]